MKYFPSLLLFSACFLFDEEQNSNLTLSLHSAGVTSVNLNVEPEDSLSSFTFELTRDDSIVQTLSIQSDTIIKDNGLNPNTTYTYTGYWMDGTKRVGESNILSVTTMDTTSHNFTWEIDTLGEYGSYLNDVWIVDENDIWVVGEIITDSGWYNLAKWDGLNWSLELVGSVGGGLYNIYNFNENDIWVLSSFPFHWDGNEWTMYHLQNMGIISGGLSNGAMWGTSSSNMYFVGFGGKIVHYDGNEFVKMASPKNQDIEGIVGVIDPKTGQSQIWAYGWPDAPYNGYLLQSDGLSWEIVWDEQNPFFEDEQFVTPTVWAKGAWFVSYTGGYDHGQITIHDSHHLTEYNIVNYNYDGAIRRIHGENINDFFGVGDFGNVFHFNGLTTKHYHELSNTLKYASVYQLGDMVVIVNAYLSQVIIGKRIL
ncbi:MAG: hypothetical protein HOD28_05600 [Candidatus Marinimicrobia bacterium]|jgi:hypothetical protein|nr:hypothetical protein [Candidatus Neomarinimicrobiota bacterium]MBT4578811.1 hypothetical protein [Candidatus Neomarinimicrobiota bacterium]MBT5759497.1 hypothetical protein [Candidatus Neomarinimicrobiota bacterium]